MLPALALALLLQQAAPAEAVFPKGGGERYAREIRADLRRCHVTPRSFTLADDFIDDEVVIHLQKSDLSDEQVGCLANTPGLDGVTIGFEDQEDAALYRQRFAQRPDVVATQTRMITQLREQLAEQGVLAGMPRLDPAQPLSTYTTAVERHCGAEPGSILTPDDETRSVSPPLTGLTFNDATQCVFGILTLALMEGAGADIRLTGEDHVP